jgi:outer membrane protein OmpA-like peptidoglycan-associated protein
MNDTVAAPPDATATKKADNSRIPLYVALDSVNTVALGQDGVIFDILYSPSEQFCIVLDETGYKQLEQIEFKLDQAAKQLSGSRTQIGNNHTALVDAQDMVRAKVSEVLKGVGRKDIAPLVDGSVGFQEMIRIGRSKYSLVPGDFIESFKSKPKHFLQLPREVIGKVKELAREEEVSDSLRSWRYTAEDERKDPSKKQGTLNRNAVREAFFDVKTNVKQKWDLLEYEKNGQIPSSVIARGLLPSVAKFLSEDDFELIDKWIAKVNEDANASFNQYTKYRDAALAALDKKVETSDNYLDRVLKQVDWKSAEKSRTEDLKQYFLLEDWDFAQRMVGDIWGEQSDIYLDLKDITYKKASDSDQRTTIRNQIARRPLPPVHWDGSAAAQFMRYSLGATVQAEFDLLKKGKLAIGADAAFDASLAQAKLEGHFTWPHTEGHPLKPKIKVRREAIEYKIYGSSAQKFYQQRQDVTLPYFAVDCSMLTPAGAANIFSVLRHWDVLKQDANRSNTDAANRGFFLQVVGHTSATGSDEHNQRLGLRRAAIVADFINPRHFEWYNHFQSGLWGEPEIEFMGYVLLIFRGHIPAKVDWNRIGSSDRKIPLIQQLKQQMPELETYRKKLLPQLVNQVFVPRAQWNEPFVEKIPGKRISKLQQLINHYIQAIIAYASKQNGVASGWHAQLLKGVELYSTPIVSKGKTDPVVSTQAETFRNRRCDFVAWEIDRANSKIVTDDIEVHFGDLRLQVTGHLSGWAGVNLQLGAKAELACPQGMLAVVGAINDQRKTGQTSDKNKDGMKAAVAGQVNAAAFAGAKAELGLKGALEWRPPPEESGRNQKHKPPVFGVLGSVGWTVTGMAGIGASAEFKVGFDQYSRRFVLKMQAEACLGPGFGGQLDIVVGIGQCWDFIVLVHGVLRKHNFKYVDIFETEADGSPVDVFELFAAFSWKIMREVGYVPGAPLVAGATLAAGSVVSACVAILDGWDDLVDNWRQAEIIEDQIKKLIDTIHKKPEMMKYLTPETKGRILYELISISGNREDLWQSVLNLDINHRREEAALTLLIEGIATKVDWWETLEHMGEIHNGKMIPQIKPGQTQAQKSLRVKANEQYLKDMLLRDPEDWARLMRHIEKLQE